MLNGAKGQPNGKVRETSTICPTFSRSLRELEGEQGDDTLAM
jgi:hypothetical protein